MNSNTENYFSDKELVDKVLNGDTRVFELIIKNTKRLVAQIVFKMISDPEDRKDMAQDVYVKAFKSLPGFKFQSKLSTWIARITYTTCLNYLEKKKPDKLPAPLDDTDHDDPQQLPSTHTFINSSTNETESALFRNELIGILQTEIDLLPPLYRTLVTLYHNEDLSYEEINEITGLPEGTVKNYLFRARKMLKENLLSKYPKEELR